LVKTFNLNVKNKATKMVPNASVLTKSFSKAGNDTSIEAAFVEPDHKSRPLDEVLIGS